MKTALITGASRGIGRAIACEFAKHNMNLAICSSSSETELKALAAELEKNFGIQVLYFTGNVGDYDFMKTMVESTLKSFGKIDILVNNAGISYVGLLTDMSIDDWNRIVNVNLTSVFNSCKQVVPSMVHEQAGKIINISSVWGEVGASCEVAYSATKGGINAFTKALGKELAPSNIQVNAISCGCVDTAMNSCFSDEEKAELAEEIPAGRFAKADEVAELVFSIADGKNYLNGQVIRLDGAWI